MKPYSVLLIFLVLMIVEISKTIAQSPAWHRINPKPFESSIKDCQLLSNGRIVAVGSGACVIVTDDYGESWDINYKPDDLYYKTELRAVHFINDQKGWAVGSYQSIIATEDGGESWTLLLQGSISHYPWYSDVEFINDSTGFIIQQDDYLLKTTDAGWTWTQVPGIDTCSFNQIQFVSEEVGFLLGIDDYILRTSDAGSSWEYLKINPGIENFSINTLFFNNPDTGFIGGGEYTISNHTHLILKTIDGGESWQEVNRDDWCSSDDFFFVNADTGYSLGYVIWYSNNLLRTFDGGNTWEIITDYIGANPLETLTMTNEGTGLCLGDNGQFFRSEDFGSTWDNQSTYPFMYRKELFNSYILNDSEILACYYGYGGGVPTDGVIKSYDRGDSWVHYDSLNAYNFIHFVNELVGFYSYGSNRIFRTANGGVSWDYTELGESYTGLENIAFISDNIGFVSGTRGNDYGFRLYKTNDCGLNWVEIENEIFEFIDFETDIDFFDDSTGIIVGVTYLNPPDGKAHVVITNDQGQTWRMDTLEFLYDFSDIHIINENTAILLGWEKICKTTDKGETWYQVQFSHNSYVNQLSVLCFGSENTAYLGLCGTNSNLFKTDDAGDSWFEIESPSTADILSMRFYSDDEGVVLGEEGTIFKTYTGGLVDVPEFNDMTEKEIRMKSYPNPFTEYINIEHEAGLVGQSEARIFNIEGKLIKTINLSLQSNIFTWDGRNDSGINAPPGIYICTLTFHDHRESVKIIKIK